MKLAILSILSCILCSRVYGFNLDKNWPILHYGPDDSLFGYSVALHQDSNVNWILVGAPKDVTAQPDVDQGGTVYKCPTSPIENLGICEKIPLDTEGSANDELKSHQYMGATVRSGGVNGDILACAPRFVWKTVDMKGNALREPVGQCILTNSDFTPKEDYTPCRTNQISDRTLSRITHCQAGFSAELLENGQTILLGTPGSFFMQGQLYVRSATGQKKTGEGRKERDDNYRGSPPGIYFIKFWRLCDSAFLSSYKYSLYIVIFVIRKNRDRTERNEEKICRKGSVVSSGRR